MQRRATVFSRRPTLSGISATELETLVGGDPAEAARWLAAAARNGFVEAQLAYAQILLDGRGLARDPAAAFAWFSVAASAGSVEAVNMVGRCHELGWGVPADAAEAARHYRTAAERGLDWAQYNYANLLARGAGVAPDRGEAFAWYRRAARQGHAKAMNLVGRFLEEGWAGAPPNPAAAREWYRRAAEGGDFRGQFNHATALLQQGRLDEAIPWFRRTAENGTLGVLRSLARALAEHPHPALRAVAFDAHRRCCEQGSADDFFRYGRALAAAGSTPADRRQALEWLRRARDAGHAGAKTILCRLDEGPLPAAGPDGGVLRRIRVRLLWIVAGVSGRRIANDSHLR
jgi:TPR repeat protein